MTLRLLSLEAENALSHMIRRKERERERERETMA
jgi:hypothetical protein